MSGGRRRYRGEDQKRCGLSWGVIQYHFGDRAGLFLALLECPAPLVDRAERLVTTSLRGLALERATDGPRREQAADRAAIKNAASRILQLQEQPTESKEDP